MSRRIKLLVGGGLIAVTLLAAAMLVSFSATAATGSAAVPASQNQTDAIVQPASQGQSATLEQPASQLDQAQTDLSEMAAAPAVTGTNRSQGPGRPFASTGPEVQGAITKVENNGTKLTINGRTVNLNDQTTVGDANGTLKVTDLKQGDRVTVLGKVESDNSLTARWVLRLPALPSVVQGTISGLNEAGNSFTFKTRDTTEWTATVTSATVYTRSGQTAKLSDFKVGDQVAVSGLADQTAKKIEAQRVVSGGKSGTPSTRGNSVRGTVKSVDATGNSLVVTEGQTDLKVTVDSSTRFLGQNLKSLADLKAGDAVSVGGTKQSDGSYKATLIARGTVGGPGKPTGDTNFFNGSVNNGPVDPSFYTSPGDTTDAQFYQQG